MENQCHVHWLGLVPYTEAWDLQARLANGIAAGKRPPTLLLLEHPHTYTFGRRGSAENLLWDEGELRRRGVDVHWVDRGGDVTYHGPGQLVGYPLLPLDTGGLMPGNEQEATQNRNAHIPKADYIGYLRKLELTLIKALFQFGVQGRQLEGLTGVWLDLGATGLDEVKETEYLKIASIGVKVDVNGISRHGFALNVAPDMSYWKGIIACGLSNVQETSLAKLINPAPNLQQVCKAVISSFGEVFNYTMAEVPLDL